MKFTFKHNKRSNLYVMLIACFAGIWLMVDRFGVLTPQDLLKFLGYIFVLLIVVLVITIPLALILRWLQSRNDN